MGWFSDLVGGALNILSDVTGIRELSPEYTREYEEAKLMAEYEKNRGRQLADIKKRMRSKNVSIKRKAQQDMKKMREESAAEMKKLESEGRSSQARSAEQHQKKLDQLIGQVTPTETTKVDYKGEVARLSRLAQGGPLKIPSRDPDTVREEMERRPK